jgi:uncharacterized RDD family membrane protein YckC
MRELDGAQLAPFNRRAIAFAIDLLIGWLLFIVVFVAVTVIRRALGVRVEPSSDDTIVRLNFFENWYGILWWVLYFGFATYFGNGRTPGKWLSGIRVVSLLHRRLDLWHSIERALGYGASTLELGFGFFQYFVHPNRRTVHDRIAETIVVLDKQSAPTQARSTPEPDRLPHNIEEPGR